MGILALINPQIEELISGNAKFSEDIDVQATRANHDQ